MTDLTPLQTIGIFVGVPIGLFLLISLLVVVPSWARDARYRPGLPWYAEPVWFEGPGAARRPHTAEPARGAVERAGERAGALAGEAQPAAEPATGPATGPAQWPGREESAVRVEPTRDGGGDRGGASAGW